MAGRVKKLQMRCPDTFGSRDLEDNRAIPAASNREAGGNVWRPKATGFFEFGGEALVGSAHPGHIADRFAFTIDVRYAFSVVNQECETIDVCSEKSGLRVTPRRSGHCWPF